MLVAVARPTATDALRTLVGLTDDVSHAAGLCIPGVIALSADAVRCMLHP